MCPQYTDAPAVGYVTIKLQNSTWYKCLNLSQTGSHTYVHKHMRKEGCTFICTYWKQENHIWCGGIKIPTLYGWKKYLCYCYVPDWFIGLEFDGPVYTIDGPVYTIKVTSSQSVYLTALLPGRLSFLSSSLVLVHILSPETDNGPKWLSGRKRMSTENSSRKSPWNNVAGPGRDQTCVLTFHE